MTMIQEQAIDMIKRMPDDKIYYVIHILEGIEGLFADQKDVTKTRSQQAYENLQRFRKCSMTERDYKKDLQEALEDKYARID